MSDPAPRLTHRLIAVTVILLLVGGGAWGFFRVWHIYRAPGPMPVAADIVIPRGNMQMTIATLRAAHLIRPDRMTSFIFRHIVQLTHHQGALHSGEFSFPAGASLRQVIAILRHGKPVQHVITVPEGLTAAQIHDLLAAAPGMTGDVPALEEGEILPQTLSYRYGDQRRQIVERYRALMQEALKKAWATRNPDPALKSPRDLLILASMVERETGRDDERARVARVFLNRLNRGMRLQSDPTVIYDVSQGEGSYPTRLRGLNWPLMTATTLMRRMDYRQGRSARPVMRPSWPSPMPRKVTHYILWRKGMGRKSSPQPSRRISRKSAVTAIISCTRQKGRSRRNDFIAARKALDLNIVFILPR